MSSRPLARPLSLPEEFFDNSRVSDSDSDDTFSDEDIPYADFPAAGDGIEYDEDIAGSDISSDQADEESSTSSSDTEDHRILIPSSDPGVEQSSPVRGTKKERAQQRMRKSRKLLARKAQERSERTAQEAYLLKLKHFQEILGLMKEHKIKFGELVEFVFDPDNGQDIRHNHFFAIPGQAHRVLNLWARRNSPSAKKQVREWAVHYVEGVVRKEARKITKSKTLQTAHRVIDQDLITGFNLQKFGKELAEKMAVVSTRIFRAIATSPYADTHSKERKAKTDLVVSSGLLTCLGEYSRRNNLVKRIITLYLYATGTQRQVIGVLSSLGIAESYSNLVSHNLRKEKSSSDDTTNTEIAEQIASEEQQESGSLIALPPQPNAARYTGTLRQLSESSRRSAQEIAADFLYGSIYDNINIGVSAPEQTIMNHSSQENGTCATIFPLFNAKLDDIHTADFQKAFFEAPPLVIDDILHTAEEAQQFKTNIKFTILRIIVAFGGEGFKIFRQELEERQPVIGPKIETHQTKLYPLPSWNIDESTITGNAEVDEAIVTELRLHETGDFWEYVRFQGGDQLSIARLRAIEIIRAGHEGGYDGFFWGAWMPGLFHGKMAEIQGLLLTHWGDVRNPASLSFSNTRLDRTPITLTSLPNFRTCRDLVYTSLYAHVLHCLLKVSGYLSLDEYIEKVTSWDLLETHAAQIHDQFVDIAKVHELRWGRNSETKKREEEFEERVRQAEAEGKTPAERPTEDPPSTQGDMVYENASLFLRDALTSREFTEAVKSGDSGRLVLVIKVWAFSFRGSGRTKYAYEMLHLIHNLTHVWPKPIREIVLHNWLLNPTGNENSFVEIDLVQEHLNYWIKVFYKAHGASATWEWLQLVSPCVNALRHLANTLNDSLGSRQGTRHAPPDLSNDISLIMESLAEHQVYNITPGRSVHKDDKPAKDIVTEGIEALINGAKNPLDEYNEGFTRLQRRRKITPIGQPSKSDDSKSLHQPSTSGSPETPHSPLPLPPPPEPTGTAEEADEDAESATSDQDFEQEDLGVENSFKEDSDLRLQFAEDVELDMDTVEVFADDVDEGTSETDSEGGEDT